MKILKHELGLVTVETVGVERGGGGGGGVSQGDDNARRYRF